MATNAALGRKVQEGGSTTSSASHSLEAKRTSITILVLGDEGVGKSSLISTFVSRHFSEVVPGIMTRVRLPPDPENSCITTIVDSQGGDGALMSAVATMSVTGGGTMAGGGPIGTLEGMGAATGQTILGTPSNAEMNILPSLRSFSTSANPSGMGGIENVDSIILIYDLDRDETFFRLENHWLPLIERCYNGNLPVIVAGNKMDLFLPSSTAGVTDEQVLARSRQQIVSLMQRFRFIRQCIKCSAKNLLRVDEVFLKAQQAVLYPFTPLYDLDLGRLSEDCQRAFTRIFRMYDRDHDGLLSHTELDRFQNETFHVPVYERDLTGWKKVVARNNPNEEVVRDGKFTVAGFLAIFDVFISQNRLDVPWQALRTFGYDDNLNLHIPDSVYQGPEGASWSLSPSARRFLTDLFHQFDSDHDGVLSLDDIDTIFAILPEPSLPPWHPIRSRELFGQSFSFPKMPTAELPQSESAGDASVLNISQSLSASGITIVSGESFPSVDMSSLDRAHMVSTPLAYLDWMGLWHASAGISPSTTRAELFQLGHVEDGRSVKRRRGKKKSVSPTREMTPDSLLPSREVRILILGSPSSGKTALINCWSQRARDALITKHTKHPETTSTYVRLKRKKTKAGKGDEYETVVVHFVITEVPEAEAESQIKRQRQLSQLLASGGCDLVVLAFDSTNSASLAYAKHLETSLLNEELARVYVATKADQSSRVHDSDRDGNVEQDDDDWHPATVIDEAILHCRDLDLEPPMVTSAVRSIDEGEQTRSEALGHLARCCLEESGFERLRSKPHEERKRREASKRRNRKMIWFGVGVGVAVAVVGYLWTSGSSSGKGAPQGGDRGGSRLGVGWIRSLFSRSESN
ncbi:Ras family protein [Nitzschia inconspicua]|uniref:Ras family protein n=1 Tax=Nitzschia inconspicua TaxID=303405 RepID=A0A9K3K5F2_9STRA|nr:Ras family protein [Nitzschia inconspicua]KAG7368883.1 Ras family protein [Nitzschia inconspicua]